MPLLTVLNRYRLTGPAKRFADAAHALAARVEREGEVGVLSYRIYVNAAEGSGRAVIDYADAAAWIGHHEIAMPWPEMAALREAARLEEVRFLGAVAPEIREWLAGSSLTARVIEGDALAGGFRRQ